LRDPTQGPVFEAFCPSPITRTEGLRYSFGPLVVNAKTQRKPLLLPEIGPHTKEENVLVVLVLKVEAVFIRAQCAFSV